MDKVKRHLADAIQTLLVERLEEELSNMGDEIGELGIEIDPLPDTILQTQVKVISGNGGPRYFNVRFSELV